jgi:hypothetical protein
MAPQLLKSPGARVRGSALSWREATKIVLKRLVVRPSEMKWGGEEEAIVVGPPSVWEDFQRGAVEARRGQRKRGLYPKGTQQRPKK